jgi:hypothetical protein
VTASPPPTIKRRAGRPRKAPARSLAGLLQNSEQDFQIYNFFAAHRIAHPRSSKDEAIAAAEDHFHCSRSAVQRRIKRLEKWMPVMDEAVKILRGVAAEPILMDINFSSLKPYEGLTERLAVFYSPDEAAELRTLIRKLSPPLAQKLVQEREELQTLRAAHKRARKKPAR